MAAFDQNRRLAAAVMTTVKQLTPRELELAQALILDIYVGMEDIQGPGRQEEMGRRLYAGLGEVHPDDWPALFGPNSAKDLSYLAAAYSEARLECRRRGVFA